MTENDSGDAGGLDNPRRASLWMALLSSPARHASRLMLASIATLAFTLIASVNTMSPAGERPDTDLLALDPYLPLGPSCNRGAELPFNGALAQVSGTMEGAIGASERYSDGYSCSGFVPLEPQFCIYLPVDGHYSFAVSDSRGVDTVLVIVNSDDIIASCDDDSNGGLRPRAGGLLAAGNYYIYVGTFSRGQSGAFDLVVTAE
jgi:hypothetical protein